MAIQSLRDLIPDPHNRRKHNPRNLEMLQASISEVGAARSIVIDETGEILAGNGMVQAAMASGLDRVQVVDVEGDTVVAVRRSGLTVEQKRALAIYDNRTAELAEWDWQQLEADRADGLGLEAWFTPEELAAESKTPKPGKTEPDAVPAPRPTDIQRGDLFALGAHRLLCGDSTKAEDVARVMDGQPADLVFTSPPYGQQRDYGQQIADWHALMLGVFAVLPAHERTQVLVNLGLIHRENEWMPYWEGWVEWMRAQGWRRFGLYVWDQMHGLRGDWNGRFSPSFEFVFHFNQVAVRPQKWVESLHVGEKGGALRSADGSFAPVTTEDIQPFKIPDSVWRAQRQKGGIDGHPAPYSVAVCDIALKSWPGRVFEPFAGSGTTIISAEGLQQSCCAIEIEPPYCQVAIDRWEAFTGHRAVKVGEYART